MDRYDYDSYTEADVRRALVKESRSLEDFKALLSPAAMPLLEEMAQAAQAETRKHFGNSIAMFTPVYIANYCENYCIYCGFNCHNKIKRAQLDEAEMEREFAAVAETGLQEILILTGESRKKSTVEYIGKACQIARKYFRVIGLEVYPMNSDEYAYLQTCGADYVTVFQETYNSDKYETLHLAGHKRSFPTGSRPGAGPYGRHERCGFAALLGWTISGKMHLPPACMHICCRRNIPTGRSPSPVRGFVPLSTMTRSIPWMSTRPSFSR